MKIKYFNSKTYGRKRVMIDDADISILISRKWHLHKVRGLFYIVSHKKTGRTWTMGSSITYLHRLIMGIDEKTVHIDHIDGNGLNNQRSNLRICTQRQNLQNKTKVPASSSSKYKGVFLYTPIYMYRKKSGEIVRKKYPPVWSATITINGKQKMLGRFSSQRKAAIAYDLKAKEHFGEFACLNFKPITDNNGK